MKALQRVVRSLIFLGSVVHLVGSQVKHSMSQKDLCQNPQMDVQWMRKNMLQWETCEGEKVEGTFGKIARLVSVLGSLLVPLAVFRGLGVTSYPQPPLVRAWVYCGY